MIKTGLPLLQYRIKGKHLSHSTRKAIQSDLQLPGLTNDAKTRWINLLQSSETDRIHQITGKPKDYAPVVYRLAWMKENENDLFLKTAMFCDVQTFLVNKLTGHYKTSWASADPLGLFDLENKIWSPEILRQLNITTQQLPEAYCPGTLLGILTKEAAEATGLNSGTRVIAGGGDGQSAGLGVNALMPDRAYLNLGTAVVSGTYAGNYIVDRAFRTMASCSGDGYYFETSLRSGTFLIDWFIKKLLKIDPAQ